MQSFDETTRLLSGSTNNKQPAAGYTTYLTRNDSNTQLYNIRSSKSAKIDNTSKYLGPKAAYTFTTLSMIIQGTLAFLLWEFIWRNLVRETISTFFYETTLYLVGVPLFVGSVIGKVGLVVPYNIESFEQLIRSILLLIYDPKQWLAERKRDWQQLTLKDIILYLPNIIMTVIAATVFSIGLTNLGANGIANLLRSYNKPFLNSIANFVVTKLFQSPFVFSSMLCNLLCFPSIHRNAVARIMQFLTMLITNPSYLHMQEDVMRCLLAANLQLKIAAEERDNNKLNYILNQLFNTIEDSRFNLNINELTTQQVDDILRNKITLSRLIRLGRPSISSVNIEYGFEFVTTRTTAVVILGFVLRGLLNFYNYGEKTAGLVHLPSLSVPAGISDYLSMCSIGLDAVFLPTVNFLKSILFGRRYKAEIISFPTQVTLATITTILIGLGGFPNGYQQAQLSDNRLETGIAIFAAWIELFGTYNLIKNPIEQRKIKKNNFDRLIYNLQRQIDEAMNEFSHLPPEEVKYLTQLLVAPEQSEKIQMMNPQRKTFVSIKDNIQHCLWRNKNKASPVADASNYQAVPRAGVN